VSPAFKRYRDAAIVVLLLAVPFFVLKANMKAPENQSAMDRAILRVSAPVEVAAATVARGISGVFEDYVYLADVKQDNERLAYDNARLREHVHSLEQMQTENRQLRRLLQLKDSMPVDAVSAQVVGKDFTEFFRVTRVVLDLKTAQSFQVFPYGHTVIIKVTSGVPNTNANTKLEVDDFPPTVRPGLVPASYAAGQRVQTPPAPAKPPLEVTFRNGLLSIRANKASLSEILFAVHERTGAEVAVAAGAETEQVVAEYGPAPAPEVLAQLLNGSRFNFLILSSPNNPQKLDRVILSLRGNGVVAPLQQMPTPAEDEEPNPPVATNPLNEPPVANAPPQPPPKTPPETRPDENNSPD